MGKLGVDLEIVFKLKLKQVSKKKNSHKLIFFNEKKNQKDSDLLDNFCMYGRP
jgi:hypothetical protein